MVQSRRMKLGRIFCASLLVALLVAWGSDRAAAQLETRSDALVPGEGRNSVAGDFNGDGNLDVAVAGSSLWVFLGKGDGTFRKPVNYSYPLGVPIAIGDFNGDGKLDLVVGGQLGTGGPGADTVNVLLGNGDGTFQAPLVSTTNGFPTFIAVGDFNNDHKLDLVIIDDPGYVSVLLGNGDGTFQAPIDNNSFPAPHWLTVGDFNNDHRLDVAVTGFAGEGANLGTLLGNGDGTLQPALIHPLNSTPASVAAGDFSRDGNLDVAISDYLGGGVAVLLGNGDGTFQPEVDYSPAGEDVVAVDFNGDGVLDLVSAGVYVMLGNGDGSFGPVQLFPAGKSLGSMLVGDFNGDHKPDVVITDAIVGEITLLNTGVVNFAPSSPVSFPSQLINTTSSRKTVNLTNRGVVALSISSIKVSGPFQMTTTCGLKVPAGAGCSISLTFTPSAARTEQGFVTLVDSASSKPQVVEASGVGTALKLSPASLNFGSEKVGKTSPPQQITVTNEATSTVTFGRIAVGGRDFKDFTLQSETCSPSLAAGGSCAATLTFTPTKSGNRSADLDITVTGGGSPAPGVLAGNGAGALK